MLYIYAAHTLQLHFTSKYFNETGNCRVWTTQYNMYNCDTSKDSTPQKIRCKFFQLMTLFVGSLNSSDLYVCMYEKGLPRWLVSRIRDIHTVSMSWTTGKAFSQHPRFAASGIHATHPATLDRTVDHFGTVWGIGLDATNARRWNTKWWLQRIGAAEGTDWILGQ